MCDACLHTPRLHACYLKRSISVLLQGAAACVTYVEQAQQMLTTPVLLLPVDGRTSLCLCGCVSGKLQETDKNSCAQ